MSFWGWMTQATIITTVLCSNRGIATEKINK